MSEDITRLDFESQDADERSFLETDSGRSFSLGKPLGPEWKHKPGGAPDRYVGLVGSGNIRQVGVEWTSLGKKVDLTREAHTLPRRTLISIEGEDRPRYLLGRGHMVDVSESMRQQKIVSIDFRSHLQENGVDEFAVTIGDPIWENGDVVTAVVQEDPDAGHWMDIEADVQSPFENVQQALRNLPNTTERLNAITTNQRDLSWLIQA